MPAARSTDPRKPDGLDQTSMIAAPRAFYPWVDPLRAFAAMSVVLAHLAGMSGLAIPVAWPLGWFRLGFLGVDIFFAISGAVIVISLDALRREYGARWRRQFAIRRLARIVPLYLLTGVAFVLLIKPDIAQRSDFGWQVLAHLLFVQNLHPLTFGGINGPSWSLGVEMQFYALAIVAGGLLLRVRPVLLGIGFLLVSVVWRTLAMEVARAGSVLPPSFLPSQLPGVIDAFAMGMLAARWRLQRREPLRPGHVLALAGVALSLWVAALALMTRVMGDYWQLPLGTVAAHAFVALASGTTVAAALALPPPARGGPLLRWSGNVSYGIYLWHLGVLLGVAAAWPSLSPTVHSMLVIAITLLLSTLSWFALERPVQRWARRASAREAARAPAST